MGSIKRSVDIESREVRMRFAKISKASWAELYFDLYRQCFGEVASEEECMQDAEKRLQTLQANFPERYERQQFRKALDREGQEYLATLSRGEYPKSDEEAIRDQRCEACHDKGCDQCSSEWSDLDDKFVEF